MTEDQEFQGTMPVREAHRFDVDALERYLRDRIDGFAGPVTVEQFKGGQSNPTYLVTAGPLRYALRRKPPGRLLPSAHAVDREYRVMTALAPTDVPVPRTRCLCEDDTVIGTAFFVMDYVPGRVLWDPSLPRATLSERAAMFAEMNRVIAALHRVDYAAIDLVDYGKPGNYFARQIDRWTKQYRASETERIEAMENLIAWLPANVPPGEATSIVHGDYRLDNLVWSPTEPRIVAVLDWELSTLGHPLADFAYHMMTWKVAPGEFRGLLGHDLAALGIPSETAYQDAYAKRTGIGPIDPVHWGFYLAYNMFRLAGILQGVMARALQGNASSARAIEAGKRTRPMAEAAWRQVEALHDSRSRGR
jgi:aminoglycoside phosphotransferase (APT) family kinase protein